MTVTGPNSLHENSKAKTCNDCLSAVYKQHFVLQLNFPNKTTASKSTS